jgi:hypothetical protein
VRKILHVSLSTDAADWPDELLVGLLTFGGREATAGEARGYLVAERNRGVKCIRMTSDCVGFTPENGCPGHEVREATEADLEGTWCGRCASAACAGCGAPAERARMVPRREIVGV